MPINIWTKKFMLRPVTHCRSGCRGAWRTAHSTGRWEDEGKQKEKGTGKKLKINSD